MDMQCAALSSLYLWIGPIPFSDTHFFLSSGGKALSLYLIPSDFKKTHKPTQPAKPPPPTLSLIVIVPHFSGALIENLLLSSI